MFHEGRNVKKTSDSVTNCIVFFHRCFIDFSSRIDANLHKKLEMRYRVRTSTRNPRLERHSSANNRFSVDFSDPSSCLGASRDVPGASQKPSMFSSTFACGSKPARTCHREASGRPRACSRHLPGTILRRFWIVLGINLRPTWQTWKRVR